MKVILTSGILLFLNVGVSEGSAPDEIFASDLNNAAKSHPSIYSPTTVVDSTGMDIDKLLNGDTTPTMLSDSSCASAMAFFCKRDDEYTFQDSVRCLEASARLPTLLHNHL